MARQWLWPGRSSCRTLAGMLLCTAPALAGPAWAANPQAVNAGKTLYIKYCATCHGANGKGDGPLAATLKTTPSDLTLLAKKNGGKFPYMDVLDIIDGNVAFPAHGSREMPAWGETFQSDSPGGGGSTMDQAVVRGRLMLLTDYLRTIQTQ